MVEHLRVSLNRHRLLVSQRLDHRLPPSLLPSRLAPVASRRPAHGTMITSLQVKSIRFPFITKCNCNIKLELPIDWKQKVRKNEEKSHDGARRWSRGVGGDGSIDNTSITLIGLQLDWILSSFFSSPPSLVLLMNCISFLFFCSCCARKRIRQKRSWTCSLQSHRLRTAFISD